MVTGDPPFISQDRRKLHLSIRQGRIRFPKFSTAPCNSVLKGLLTRDVDKRLGCSRTTMFKIGGVRALKDHGFFSGLSWDALLAKQMRPPIVPLLAHGSDTQYFETVSVALLLSRPPPLSPAARSRVSASACPVAVRCYLGPTSTSIALLYGRFGA